MHRKTRYFCYSYLITDKAATKVTEEVIKSNSKLVMKKIPLSKTNPYLKDPIKRREMIVRAVKSSTAIEGINIAGNLVAALIKDSSQLTK